MTEESEREDAVLFEKMMSRRWSRWIFYLACLWSLFVTSATILIFIGVVMVVINDLRLIG
jgi:hypothetical protein